MKPLEINLTAPCLWITEFSKYFDHNNLSGSIINITRLVAELAFLDNLPCISSKGSLKQITKASALKLDSIGVTGSNVGPEYIQTKFNSGSLSNPKVCLKRSKRFMLNRWRLASKVADAVSFLASGQARFIINQNIYFDGGWLARGIN